MDTIQFTVNFKSAFGEAARLPILFWYSDTPEYPTEKINGCFFKAMTGVLSGTPVSLSADTITCGGGKLYTGFAEMPERVPDFVSLKERYKETPELVRSFIQELNWHLSDKQYLHFARIDQVDSFDGKEGLLFFATPDVLSGLTTWCYFDSNADDAVSAPFGSGCSSIVTQAVQENRRGGKRTFLGLFDPSVRPYMDEHLLSYVIPLSRFREMYETMPRSCLFNTHAWERVKQRINQ